VVQGVEADDAVEARVGKRQAQPVGGDEVGAAGLEPPIGRPPLACEGEDLRVEIERHRAVAEPVEELGGKARPGTELHHQIARRAVQCIAGDGPVEDVPPGPLVLAREERKT